MLPLKRLCLQRHLLMCFLEYRLCMLSSSLRSLHSAQWQLFCSAHGPLTCCRRTPSTTEWSIGYSAEGLHLRRLM